jgi:glutamine synthetase
LHEAVLGAEASPFVRATLGDEMFESFIRNKKLEWDEYKMQVSEYEIRRYLPLL